jgi:predicted 3-demethylubiquinone-9 3-methyltransferase (glyoxalase superfamily)
VPHCASPGDDPLSGENFDAAVDCKPAVTTIGEIATALAAAPDRRHAMAHTQRISPCLWFDSQAEDAAKYYVSIFKDSKILKTTRYGEAGKEIHGKPAGSVLTVEFELDGQTFTALNGGPVFKFNEAVSLVIHCETQQEVDHYWDKLTAGGEPKAQQCGWLKDKYGVSWQVVPRALVELLSDKDRAKAERTMKAMLQMKKIDVAELKRAHAG